MTAADDNITVSIASSLLSKYFVTIVSYNDVLKRTL